MAAGDLCTTADVEQFLSLNAGQDNALLTKLVSSASAFVANFCSRTFLTAAYTETRNGLGGAQMMFRQAPVTAVASVVIDGVAVPLSISAGMSGYVFDDKALYLRGCYCFTRNFQNVVLNYTAGFATIPTDIAQATVEIIGAKYKRRTDLHVSSKLLDGQQITYNMKDIPPSAMVVLNQYNRIMIP